MLCLRYCVRQAASQWLSITPSAHLWYGSLWLHPKGSVKGTSARSHQACSMLMTPLQISKEGIRITPLCTIPPRFAPLIASARSPVHSLRPGVFACSCGTIWCCNAGRASLPRTYQWQSNVYALAYGLPSLACQGKAVVRSVFKQNNMAWNRPGCADFRLRADFGDTLGKATEVVRCELALPSGGGSETERALRSKEVNCRICNACGDGGCGSLQLPACSRAASA
jgi:hypothetical protein